MTLMPKRIMIFYTLLAGVFCSYLPIFQSPFLAPKLIFLILSVGFGVMIMLRQTRLVVTSLSALLWILGIFITLLLSFIPSTNPFDSLSHLCYYLQFFLLFFIALNLDDKRFKIFNHFSPFPFLVFISGVFISLFGFYELGSMLASGTELTRISSLLGNSEFYATFLAISFLMSLQFQPQFSLFPNKERRKSIHNWKIWMGQVIILLGIPLSLNKGTFVFLFGYLLVRLVREKRWWAAFALLLGLAWVITLFLDYFTLSLQSRLFLWIISGWMFLNHALFGVGIGQFGHQYIDMVYDLFQRFPFLSLIFGSFVTGVENAHQILFHYSAELGILGFIFLSIFLFFMIKLIFSENHRYSTSLSFLLFKSSFTLVTTAVTSMALWVFITAIAYKKTYLKKIVFKPYLKIIFLTLFIISATYSSTLIYSDYLYLKGRESLAKQQLEDANNYFQTCTTLYPGHSDSYLSMAYIGYLTHNLNKMEYNLYRAQHLYHDSAAIQLEADMRFFMKDYKRAKPLYSYLNVVFPDHLGQQIKLAVIELHEGKPREAKQIATDVMTSEPRISNPAHATYKEIAKRILLN